MKKLIGLGWILIACIIGSGFALGLAPIAHIIPWSVEKKLAHWLNTDSAISQCSHSSAAQKILENFILRIYPLDESDKNFSINVQIIKRDEVNAYATLGGEIKINSGLLEKANSGEELAGVIAHEIEHVRNRHIMEGTIVHLFTVEGLSLIFGQHSAATSWIQYFANITFTKKQEAQADEGAFKRLQKSQVSNQGIKDFFVRMEKEKSFANFLSDHPANKSRLQMAEKFSNDNTRAILNEDEWKILQHYCK